MTTPATRDELLAFVLAYLRLDAETVLWKRAEAILKRETTTQRR